MSEAEQLEALRLLGKAALCLRLAGRTINDEWGPGAGKEERELSQEIAAFVRTVASAQGEEVSK